MSLTGMCELIPELKIRLRVVTDRLENVISEIHRILKPECVLSFEKTRVSEKKLIAEVENEGFI